jgi:hypothetical protein
VTLSSTGGGGGPRGVTRGDGDDGGDVAAAVVAVTVNVYATVAGFFLQLHDGREVCVHA